jgi:hypothetical protein
VTGPALPPDWRERLVGMVAGREPVSADAFGARSTLSAEFQVELYRDQYRLRLHDGLRGELVGLVRWVPDPGEGGWDPVFASFLLEHPAHSFTLNRVADGFPDWWQARGAPPAWVELARLDAAVSRAFEAGEPEVLPSPPPERVQLAPSVALFHLTHNVHDIRRAVLMDEEPPALRQQEVGVVIYRDGREVRHWAPAPALFEILAQLQGGGVLEDAIVAPFALGLLDVPTLQQELPGFMAQVAVRRLLAPIGPPVPVVPE